AEADESNSSVDYGGLPDRDGRVTLDACIMGWNGDIGAVCALEDVVHAVSVARRVMERTPHTMLVGEGARTFALEQGFEPTNLLTPRAEAAWREWLKTADYAPRPNSENTDWGSQGPAMRPAGDRRGPAHGRRLHHLGDGLQDARPGRRQPDHRRRPVCR
ncbi:MAG: N4-(beta-N-acetylglucosaminyl)-L-asparaginase, partial [bacterium]